MIYSSVYKAKAREALRGHWQTALLIALIVNLPSLLVQGIAAFTKNDPTLRLEDLLIRAAGNEAAMTALPDALRAMLSETGVLVIIGLTVLAWLLTPALSLGMNHWALDRIRGQEEPISAVFSRIRIFAKGIGLRLFVLLKTLLWMLPGIAVTLLSLIPLYTARPASLSEAQSTVWISSSLIYFGMILMLVLGIMGYLYYAMADFILADEPEERVLTCARRSRDMMKGRRGLLMTLMLSFLLWYLLILLASSAVVSIAGPVAGLVVQMLGSLAVSVYMLMAQGVFYEALSPVRNSAPPVPEDSAGLDE